MLTYCEQFLCIVDFITNDVTLVLLVVQEVKVQRNSKSQKTIFEMDIILAKIWKCHCNC